MPIGISKKMAFIRQVRAQRGKMLTPEEADQLILDASEILRILTGSTPQNSLRDRVPRETDPVRNGPFPGSGTFKGLSKR
jgi:hypothetical protein